MSADEITGQLRGGPDDGNLISSRTPDVPCRVTYEHVLGGPESEPVKTVVHGVYRWNQDNGTFDWEHRGVSFG